MYDKILATVRKAKQGDCEASAQLFQETERMVYFTALKITRDEDAAREIVQDTYTKVYTNLASLRHDEAVISWVKTIVVNLSKDYLMKRRSDLFETKEDEEQSLQSVQETYEDFLPEAYVDSQEKTRLIMDIVEALPETLRMAVIYYYYNEQSVGDIAQIMEVSEGTIKSRLNYARKQIKVQIVALEKEGTKLYGFPLFPLSKILQKASLDYSLPQGISEHILAKALDAADIISASEVAAPIEATVSTKRGIITKLTTLPRSLKIGAAIMASAIIVALIFRAPSIESSVAEIPSADNIQLTNGTLDATEPDIQVTVEAEAESAMVVDDILEMDWEEALALFWPCGGAVVSTEGLVMKGMLDFIENSNDGVKGILGFSKKAISLMEKAEEVAQSHILFGDKAFLAYRDGMGVFIATIYSDQYSFRGIRIGMNMTEVSDTLLSFPDIKLIGLNIDERRMPNISYSFGASCSVILHYDEGELLREFALLPH